MPQIYKKECEECMQRKKSISEYKFIDIKDNRLIYKCKECNDESHKPINGLQEKFLNTSQFCSGDVNKFFCY